MFKITQKVRDHLAKAVLTPLSISALGLALFQGWTTGGIGMILYGVVLFLITQTGAVLLLSYQDDDQDKKQGHK